ncbi:MAG: hypothetical protein Q8O26_03350 [Phreatobacter sp.]|uniref:hypothetical protein n=1 Tax=Phreatobacter sp. TaxID=1966341 RepID=UPI00273596FC|nr:hypothetical protein [Phreatobacter sp.]MDP2800896.1 hypothetical protein [Phreatobacter sp.]
MTIFRGSRLAASFAVTMLASGLTFGMPSSAARAASLIDVAPFSSLDATHSPVEMQRRGDGFRRGGPGFRGPRPGFAGRPGVGGRPGFRGGRGGGNVGAAIGLGAAALIIGGAAAAAASQRESYRERECWIERRWVDTPYGPERRRVRICE